jgi:hypothetical protein
LLARIAEHPDVDPDTRALCDEASLRLMDRRTEEQPCRPCQH